MRWDELFADLENRFVGLSEDADDAELADRQRVEQGRVTYLERVAGAVGGAVSVHLVVGPPVQGTLLQFGIDWMLLRDPSGAESLVSTSHITAVDGLTARTGTVRKPSRANTDLRRLLRSLARNRVPVTLTVVSGVESQGTIDRVGADFVEMAAHPGWELRRVASVQGVRLVPIAAIVHVRSLPLG